MTQVTYNRLQPDERRAAILQAAIRLAESDGWLKLSRDIAQSSPNMGERLFSAHRFTSSIFCTDFAISKRARCIPSVRTFHQSSKGA